MQYQHSPAKLQRLSFKHHHSDKSVWWPHMCLLQSQCLPSSAKHNVLFYWKKHIFIIKKSKGRCKRYTIALSGLKLHSLGINICYYHLLQTQIVNLKTCLRVATCSMISKLSNWKGIWNNFHNIIFQITQSFWGCLVIQKLKKFPSSFPKDDTTITASMTTEPHLKMGQYNSFSPLGFTLDFLVAPSKQKHTSPPIIINS
jgi:hypothetical protein